MAGAFSSAFSEAFDRVRDAVRPLRMGGGWTQDERFPWAPARLNARGAGLSIEVFELPEPPPLPPPPVVVPPPVYVEPPPENVELEWHVHALKVSSPVLVKFDRVSAAAYQNKIAESVIAKSRELDMELARSVLSKRRADLDKALAALQ